MDILIIDGDLSKNKRGSDEINPHHEIVSSLFWVNNQQFDISSISVTIYKWFIIG